MKDLSKFEWKKDPANDMWIGPDTCHYDTQREAMHFGVLGMCGCGNPKEAYNFLRDILKICDRRANHDDDKAPWVNAQEEIAKLVAANPDLSAHVLLHFLTDKDVLEHGGSVGGSWLTSMGQQIVDGEAAPRKK